MGASQNNEKQPLLNESQSRSASCPPSRSPRSGEDSSFLVPQPDEDKLPTIRAAIADADGSPKLDDSCFVLVRPHPYHRFDEEDDGNIRTFVYKGKAFEVPLLPLHELDEDRKKSKEVINASKGAGWQVVKSKVVGHKALSTANIAPP
jgi:hypothetical protein